MEESGKLNYEFISSVNCQLRPRDAKAKGSGKWDEKHETNFSM